MAGERIRAFRGAEELEISSARYLINNNSIVNDAEISINPNNIVQLGSVIDVKKNDGSTNVFSGKVHNIREPNIWELDILSNGYELINTYVEKVYKNASPESIVQDIVENFTDNLSYTGANSNIVLDEYIAQGYAIDIIRSMMNALRWRLIINQNDVVHFSPEGQINNSRVLTNGNNFNVLNWETGDEGVVNQIRLEAGFELPRKIESKTGTGTEFSVDFKPESSVRVTVSGVEVSSDDYEIVPDESKLVFNSAVTNPVIEYTWRRRIIVEDEDEVSISKFGRRFNRFDAPYIRARGDARRFARELINEFSTETVTITGMIPDLDFSLQVNERVSVVDSLRSKSTIGVVQEIEYNYDEGTTYVKIGRRDFDFVLWQNGVQDRIKQLERRFSSTDRRSFVRSFTSNVNVNLETFDINNEYEILTANDSLILGHTTLGRMRENENVEVDCSNNDNTGVWQGSGIDGNQYVKEGYRLYAGAFNGSNRFIQVSGFISNVRSVAFAVKRNVNNRDILRLNSSAIISVNSSGNIATTGLSGVSIFVNNTSSISINSNNWFFVVVNFNAITANQIEIGKGSSFLDGELDEVMFFNKNFNESERQWIMDKKLYSGQSLYENDLLAWWSMDNPKLGDRREKIFPA